MEGLIAGVQSDMGERWVWVQRVMNQPTWNVSVTVGRYSWVGSPCSADSKMADWAPMMGRRLVMPWATAGDVTCVTAGKGSPCLSECHLVAAEAEAEQEGNLVTQASGAMVLETSIYQAGAEMEN